MLRHFTVRLFSFIAVALLCIHALSCLAASDDSPEIAEPSFVSPTDVTLFHGDENIQKGFKNKVPQFRYFLQEITNFVDAPSSTYFYDFVNPNISEQEFITGSFNIYEKILLLKNIEKTPKEREALHDISRFLATNYKTEILPAYIYNNNPQLPRPLYLSQIVASAFQSVQSGNIDVLHALIDNYHLLSSKDKSGNGLLATAIISHRNNMVKFLTFKGSDINAINNYGSTPLIIASRTRNLEAAKFLVQQGCDLNPLDHLGNSALNYAIENKDIKMIFLLNGKLKENS